MTLELTEFFLTFITFFFQNLYWFCLFFLKKTSLKIYIEDQAELEDGIKRGIGASSLSRTLLEC